MNATAQAFDPQAWALRVRAEREALDAALAKRYDANEAAARLTRARAEAFDGWIREAWEGCVPSDASLALFAVGGYGRRSLYPHSDVDLLVLASQSLSQGLQDAVARFIAVLWDARIPASHAVRTHAEMQAAAAADITIVTALFDAFPIVASVEDSTQLRALIAIEHMWPPREYFIAKRQELRDRHARFGDTVSNLEPNIKEGPGGLRDLQTLRWMALRLGSGHDLDAMEATGQIGHDERSTLTEAAGILQGLRYGLHLVANKREERLRFDHQRALAERLTGEDEGNAAVERMMQAYYRSAGLVTRIGERLLQRFEEQLDGDVERVAVNEHFELRGGYLAARDVAWPHGDAAQVFALFATWASLSETRGLHSLTARQLAEALPIIPAYPKSSNTLRSAFVALLRGEEPVRTLSRMAKLGVLARWIPAFAAVTGRMQFDLFHVFTVDQHTLALLANLEAFSEGRERERFSLAHEVWPWLQAPELLLLAGLFHDIAKGRGGDHSELGAVDARAFCEAHGYAEADVALVEWLVQQHLLMSVTAQKQDIADPDVVQRFAEKVSDRRRLDHLYLLTCADIAATSPKLWNAWKDRLLADLYAATRLALRRGLENPVAAEARIADAREQVAEQLRAHGLDASGMAHLPDESWLRARTGSLAWMAGALAGVQEGELRIAARLRTGHAMELMVRSPDRNGLFAAIVATLDRLDLDVHRARLLDAEGGHVLDSFELLPRDMNRPVEPSMLEHRLREVLSQQDLMHVKPARRTRPRHLGQFRVAPQVFFAPIAGLSQTLLSVVGNDRPGLLADVSEALRACQMRVHDARIATFGERAEDLFRISTNAGVPLNEAQQDALADTLRPLL